MKKFFANSTKFDLVLALSVLFYFFWVFFKYTINIPLNDDYDVISNFNDILDAESVTDKLKLFYLQHNEHRILYDKFWFYVSYWISPEGLNFNFLSFIGNLSLVALVAFYYFKLKNYQGHYFILFPLSVFILNLAFWENLTFSMASLSNFTFLLFAVISLHYLTKKETTNKDLFLSLLFFMLSILTQGGGVFILPLALLIFLVKKEKGNFFKYVIFASIITVIYFIGYEKHPSPTLSEIAENSLLHLKFFLAFLGSAIGNYHFFPDNNDEAIFRSFILGILLLIGYVYLFFKKYYKENLFNFSVMTLVMIISAVTSVTRLSQGMGTAVASRYRLVSILFLISLLICLLEFLKKKNYKIVYANGIVITISCLYLFFFNFNSTNESLMSFRKRSSTIGALYYFSNDNSLINSTKTEFCAEVLKKSDASETYILNEEFINKYYTFANKIDLKEIKDESSLNGGSTVEKIKQLKDSYYIDGYTFIDGLNTQNQSVYIILLNQGTQSVFLANNEFRAGLSSFFNAQNVDYGGFYIRIKNENILKGENQIYIMIKNEEKSKIFKTDKSLIKE